tara:strand:- start:2067 stop:4247 length:2181 start_codon:yes stop_codon:yes gene_type:complete
MTNDTKLRYRMALLFSLVCVIVVAQSAYSVKSLQSAIQSINSVNESNIQVEKLLREISNPMTKLRQLSMELVLAPNQKSIQKLNAKIDLQIKQVDRAISAREDSHLKAEQKLALNEFLQIKSAWHQYKNAQENTAHYVNNSNRVASFISVTQQEEKAYEKLLQKLNSFIHTNVQASKAVYTTDLKKSAITNSTLIVTTIITLAILICIMFTIHNMVRGYMLAKQKHETELSDATVEANAANEAKSEFLANMSHEIRTPMNAILGFTDILKAKINEPEQKNYINNVQSSGKALLSLINDILDLSKIEAGKLTLQFSSVAINDLFKELQIIFGQNCADRGLELSVKVASELPTALVLDEPRLRQVLINLIGNALKFTEKGYIRLSAECLFTESSRSQVKLRIKVKDSGIGIALDQQAKIFGSFEQSKDQKHKDFGGTGLGLTISQRLVDLMQGTLSVESEPGKGSTFEVFIPVVEVAATDSLVHKGDPSIDYDRLRFAKASVLIVDDVDYNRDILKAYMEDFGFDFHEADNGKEALSQVYKQQPDLILLDMKMPGMTGYDVTRELKENNKLSSIPVVAVTASALKQDEEIISKLCDGYLRKPVSRAELIGEVMKHLKHDMQTPDTPENQPAESQAETLSAEQADELLEICNTKITPLISKLENDPGNIDRMLEINDSLKELAESYPQEKFLQWQQKFQHAYVGLDIKQIANAIKTWPKLLKDLRQKSE